MAIQYFLPLIGCMLGCSIALAVVVKKLSESFAVSGKKPLVYGSLSAILTSGVAYLAAYALENPFEIFWALGGIFLVFGIIHIAFVHNRYFGGQRNKNGNVLFAEILFGLAVVLFTILVFSSLQYFFKDRYFLFYPVLMSSLIFFVPLLFYHSFLAAYNIPATTYPTWQYPLHKPIDLPDEDDSRDRIAVIGFEIAKKAADHRKTYFRAKGPETMKLGEFLYHFINEYNEQYSETTIEYTNRGYEPYDWWFSRKAKWYQAARIYNPELSIRENGIKENTVIICERILETVSASNTLYKQV